MTSPQLPVELWRKILEEHMSLPTLLDVNHLPEVTDPLFPRTWSDYNWTGLYNDYWEKEHHRNALQRVCKTWDAILRPFEYRFIQFKDIFHGLVPADVLGKAIRIHLATCGEIDCQYCTHSTESLSSLISSVEELSVKIISWDIRDQHESALYILDRMWNQMPHLEFIINEPSDEPEVWSRLMRYFPKLISLRLTTSHTLNWPTCSAINITTLSYGNHISPFSLPVGKLHLPSLRHLRFTVISSQIARHIDRLFPLLERFGENLHSLQLGMYGVSPISVPRELWVFCPRLERLDSTLCLQYPPPPGHPLHTVSIPFPFDWAQSMDIILPFPAPLEDWPSLRRILFSEEGSYIHPRCRPYMLNWIQECSRYRIRLEDVDGEAFEEDRIEEND